MTDKSEMCYLDGYIKALEDVIALMNVDGCEE